MRMNLVITEVPFGDGAIDAHIDTTEGASSSRRGTSTRRT